MTNSTLILFLLLVLFIHISNTAFRKIEKPRAIIEPQVVKTYEGSGGSLYHILVDAPTEKGKLK